MSWFTLGRQAWPAGRTVPKASTSAINAPSPKDGEVRRTALPDTWDGIRFEIGRMIQYVKDAGADPLVLNHVRRVCEDHFREPASLSGRDGEDPARLCLEAIDAWCRRHFCYVNDPPGVEVLQTPRRMIKQTKVPPEVIRSIIAPFLEAMKSVQDPALIDAYQPPPVTSGDCDEGGDLEIGMCAAAPARPAALRFRFGGHGGTLHHVWSRVGCGGKWVDADLTEPDYALGDFSKFEHHEEVEVPL